MPISKQIKNTKSQTQNAKAAPNHFSYSQLAAYSSCPYQYRFAHVLKIPVLGREQFSFGKTMHATLQKLFNLLNEKKRLGQAELFGRPSGPAEVTLEELYRLYEESWIDDWYESKQKKRERRRQGRESLKVFYEKYKGGWPDALFLEKGFSLKIAAPSAKLGAAGAGDQFSYTVRGAIDRIDRLAGGLKLVDYKTGAPKDKLSFEEKEQLLIYQLAAGQLFSEPVKALAFYYLDDNSEAEFIGSETDLEKVKAKVIKTVDAVRRGVFPPKPGRLCAYCDFKEICEFRG